METDVEKDQTKENRTSKKGLVVLLMRKERPQRKDVAPRNRGKRKRHLENRRQKDWVDIRC